MEIAEHLASRIGPRPPCSPAEKEAAAWGERRLAELGYEVSTEEFTSRPFYQSWYAVYLAIAAVGTLLIVVLPLVACLLGVVSFVLYARDSEGRPLIRPRGGTSQNVIAKGADYPSVVVIAHVDSAQSSLSFHPKMVASLRTSVRLLNVVLLLVIATGAGAYVVEAGGELDTGLWIPVGLLLAYLVFAIGLQLHARYRMSPTPGANDNASGVEVLLRLAADRPPGAWFVLTGSEESGMVGIQDFISRHGIETSGAWFLNIDNVGKGRLIVTEEEGTLFAHRSDKEMARVAEAAGAELEPFRGLPTDGTVLMARKHRAISLVALGEDGVPPNWHWRSDVIEEIEPGALDAALAVARRVVAAKTLQGSQA